jgi:type I restriction enzyme M protein
MFVQSEKFVEGHQGKLNDISIYGQESNQTTWRLAKMNLAIRGIDSSQVKWNNEGSFLNDAHKDLKADYIIVNPPFNDSDWGGDLLRSDGRWKFGTPPTGNANFAWLQHFIYHLAPSGQAGVVLAKGALTSKTSGEGEIRRAMIEEGNLIDCIVNLPAKLFLNTQIPAALWFMSRDRSGRHSRESGNPVSLRNRSNEILFIDARNLGHLINRRTKELSHEDIQKIAGTYHAWRNTPSEKSRHSVNDTKGVYDAKSSRHEVNKDESSTTRHSGHDPKSSSSRHSRAGGNPVYEDIPGFCKSVTLDRVKELDYVLTPGRYVGLPDDEDDFNFKERFEILKAEFETQLKEEAELNKTISENLKRIQINE